MSWEARALESIDVALADHDETCDYKPRAILMHPIDHERLAWDDYKQIPILADERIQPDRVRVDCARHDGGHMETTVVSERKPVPA